MSSEKNRRRNSVNKPKAQATQSPIAGCSIIITATLVMIFLIGFTIWSLFRVSEEIAKFTQEQAVPTPILDPIQHEDAFNDLTLRLNGFQTAVLANEDTSITLSAEDLNLAIAAHDQFDKLRHNFFITSISADTAAIQISYKLNRQPLGKGSFRYLNGTFHGTPRLDSGQLLIDIKDIESLKGKVPDEFIAHLSDHQITAPYLEDPAMGEVMKKLTSVQLVEGGLLIKASPDQATPGQQPVTQQDIDQTRKMAAIAFGVVSALFSLFLILFLRKKKGTSPSPPSL